MNKIQNREGGVSNMTKEQNQVIQELEKGILEVLHDYVEIEFIIQDVKEKLRPEHEKKKPTYVLGPKISRKELRKNRRSRQKSWIEVNRSEYEFSIAEWRISR